MKKTIFTGIIIASSLFAQTQTVDEIINKHIAAMGGKGKMLSLKTLNMSGSFTNPQGVVGSIVITKKNNAGSRIDRNLNGSKGWVIVTPVKGWVLSLGESAPKAMPDNEVKNYQIELDLQGPFTNYKENGTKIELAEKETVEGTACYKLKVTYKNNNQASYCIDIKTHRIVKRSREDNFIIYSNYKQNADGFWFANNQIYKSGAKFNFNKIEANILVDNKLFQADESIF